MFCSIAGAKAYKKGCSDFRRNSLLPVIRQKSRYIRAQQQTGQSSAKKSAQQQRRSEANFVLRKSSGGIADVHHDFLFAFSASFLEEYEMRMLFSRKNVKEEKKI